MSHVELCRWLNLGRTPARMALAELEAVGAVELGSNGVNFTFKGYVDVRWRALSLAGAVEAGRPPSADLIEQRVAQAVGGQWGATSWRLLREWPRVAPLWGIDIRPRAAVIRTAMFRLRTERSPHLLADAIRNFVGT